MKELDKKGLLFVYVFLGFCMALFAFVGCISIPVSSVDIQQTGQPAGGTHNWYTLDKKCYTVVQQLDTIHISSSFFRGFTKSHTYFLVSVEDDVGATYDMVVRACGKEKDVLSHFESVTLYGMVSDYKFSNEVDSLGLPCLNDNGDTILSRWVKAFVFFMCSGLTIACGIYISKKNSKTFRA